MSTFWRESDGIVINSAGVVKCDKCPCDDNGEIPYCEVDLGGGFSDDFERNGRVPSGTDDWFTAPFGYVADWLIISNGSNRAVLPRGRNVLLDSQINVRRGFDPNLDTGLQFQSDLVDDAGYSTFFLDGPQQGGKRYGIWSWENIHINNFTLQGADYLGVWLYYDRQNAQFETLAPLDTSPVSVAGSLSLPHTFRIEITLNSFTPNGTEQADYDFTIVYKIDGSTVRTASNLQFTTRNSWTCNNVYGLTYRDLVYTGFQTYGSYVFDDFSITVTEATP